VFKRFFRQKLLSSEVAADRVTASELRRLYNDPGLRRDPRKYGELLRRMDAAGMLAWSASGIVTAGLFVVRKKGDRQRLIIEARVANMHFGDPDHVHLATGAASGGSGFSSATLSVSG
jgi:hypothetical protein